MLITNARKLTLSFYGLICVPDNVSRFLEKIPYQSKSISKFSTLIGYHQPICTNRTARVALIIGQCYGHCMRHACVTGQHASCTVAFDVHFAELSVVHMKTYNSVASFFLKFFTSFE